MLSDTKKLPNQRRLKPISSDVRGAISCCTETPNCQSNGRTPQPLSTAGFTIVSAFGLAKFPRSAAMHSPFGSGLIRLQSGAWLPLKSMYDRDAVVWKFGPPRPLRPSSAGLLMV